MLQGKDKRGLENCTYCDVAAIKPGATAAEQMARRERGSPQGEEAGEIVNLHRPGYNGLKGKQETRRKSQRTLRGTGSQTRQRHRELVLVLLARAGTSSRKTRSPEEKPAKEVRS